ncbi:hypothetical protein LCGC14_2706350, partial [marine sediment metagenome]
MAITFIGADAPDTPGVSGTTTPTIHASAAADDFMVAVVGKAGVADGAWADDGGGG